MANNRPETENMSGSQEDVPAEPGNNSAAARSHEESRKPSTPTGVSAPTLRKQPSSNLVPLTSSTGTSPRTSRNASPTRKDSRPQPLSTPISTQPSAAAIQRALSTASVPQLPGGAVSDAVSKLPRPPKSANTSGDTTPHWPTSPRLKSPPPSGSNSRRGSAVNQKKAEVTAAAPTISVQSATPQASTPPPPTSAKQGGDEISKVPQQLQTPQKAAPSRGASGKSTLETVQENSTDDIKEPSPAAVKAAADLRPLTKISDDDNQVRKREGAGGEGAGGEGEKHTQQGESGSESAGNKSDGKRGRRHSNPQPPSTVNNAPRPKNAPSKSYASLSSAKSRQPEGKQNMTVETETVASIPQSALNAGDRTGGGRNDNSGSIRLKPSNETIRPKKERKKTTQKARSINQGTASSKADIFEARVARDVEEANSSDSDETFVYESNPPDPQRRPRHHSRTPSVTSSHSVAEQQRSGMRNFGDVMDDRRVAGKRSMKFSNNAYNDLDSPDGKDSGSIRAHTPRHIGKFGRNASMMDQDSPFTQASKVRTNHFNARHSRPNSPRSPQSVQHQMKASSLFGKKQEPSFDFDAEGGDDERTPLIGTVRTPRSGRYPRRINSSSGHSVDEYYGVRRRSRCGRFGGCLLGLCVFVAVILSAIAFLLMSNRPMYNVNIRKIQNVLASEQEIMLDLLVGAVNPNALGVTVEDMDLNIFAKSKHVGSGKFWRDHGHASALTTSESTPVRRQKRGDIQAHQLTTPNSNPWHDLSDHRHPPSSSGGVDHGTDPDDDLERDALTMLLGRIFHFDQALSFEGSPIKRHAHYSVGELRLAKPGNKTETGGSERWEKVLQHPFELIIRGVLKYSLPISSRTERAAVGASVIVHPEDGVDEFGHMKVEVLDHGEEWQWIESEELKTV